MKRRPANAANLEKKGLQHVHNGGKAGNLCSQGFIYDTPSQE